MTEENLRAELICVELLIPDKNAVKFHNARVHSCRDLIVQTIS